MYNCFKIQLHQLVKFFICNKKYRAASDIYFFRENKIAKINGFQNFLNDVVQGYTHTSRKKIAYDFQKKNYFHEKNIFLKKEERN